MKEFQESFDHRSHENAENEGKVFLVFSNIFSIYLGLAPIYWIPFTSQNLLNAIKLILFSIIVAIPILRSITRRKIFFPGGTTAAMLIGVFFYYPFQPQFKENHKNHYTDFKVSLI